MTYIALTFWLLIIVLTAWGVHELLGGLVKRKVLNTILLPGTLVAQIGHVLGLLVTGATVNNTTLYKDDESGNPETTANPEPRIPVIGPIVIGLLPLLACALAIFVVARLLGTPILNGMNTRAVGPVLPTTVPGVWQLLRDQITLVESFVATTRQANFSDWRTSAFVYLVVCLTIRIAPFPGNLRGSLGAILVLGIGAATVSSLVDAADPRVQSAWAVLNLTVASLLFLLLVSLVVRGSVGLVKLLRTETAT